MSVNLGLSMVTFVTGSLSGRHTSEGILASSPLELRSITATPVLTIANSAALLITGHIDYGRDDSGPNRSLHPSLLITLI